MIKFYSQMQSNKIDSLAPWQLKKEIFIFKIRKVFFYALRDEQFSQMYAILFTKTFILNVYFSRVLYCPEKF